MILYIEPELVSKYPGFKVAYSIIRDVKNTQSSPEVTKLIKTLPDYVKTHEKELLSRADQMKQFYKRIGSKNRYHILSLLKSTLNGRNYNLSNPAVDLVYGVELQNAVLMGLHDLDKIQGDIYMGVARGNETLEHIFADSLNLSPGAIIFRNGAKIMASLTDGPDKETKVTEASQNILAIAFGAPEDTEASLLAAMEQTNNLFKEYNLGKPENISIAIA
ncbi:phenylalanine--tRNA ligase beta subunit-related protein [Limnofasciculus baicalensis]|uniref:Phenylalanine--tRNA ligase beta subunit-related protein n=1 Tax=Limnofasciculus baicalensis BBK-W-15 TaxID=2699891 RepID=A0AAE3KMP5_9CYAN|nr:phenylalanine--tRNA ligase beta subunit-related protein [Limnofasciculus baicalensis]MCP2729449.1 phenylalanine--tRNA ligase beta subunit-related protein [Limnofasciculus baicalensis BBK-W-15]